MRWDIVYYNQTLEEEVLRLPDTLLARYIRLTEAMKEYGPNIGMPHTKALGDGLFELRLKGKEGIARVFYCTMVKQKIMMLHEIIKKTSKTPSRALKIARARLKEVQNNGYWKSA